MRLHFTGSTWNRFSHVPVGWIAAMSRAHFGRAKPRKKGSFLYIDQISFTDEFIATKPNSDAGTEAVRQFLDASAGQWTVAAYIGDANSQMTTLQREDEASRNLEEQLYLEDQIHQGNPIDDEIPFERFQKAEHRRKRAAADVRQFVRNGFQELSEETHYETGFMYIPNGMWNAWKARPTRMTHQDSLSVNLRVDVPFEKATFIWNSKDEQLHAYLIAKKGVLMETQPRLPTALPQIDTVMEQVKKFEAAGADINRAKALHVCAENGITVLLDPLVRLGALVNDQDQSGATPLMAATDMDTDVSTIRALLALGADKNMTDRVGRTASGHFYRTHRSNIDFRSCSGLRGADKPPDPIIVSLLMPNQGATSVDTRCMK